MVASHPNVRRILSNSVWFVLSLAMLPVYSQAPKDEEAKAQAQAQTQQTAAPAQQPAQTQASQTGQPQPGQAQPQAVPTGKDPQTGLPLSQPGAPGQSKPEDTQAPLPVPPGPVPPSEIKPAPPTPIAIKKDELGDDDTWDPQWDVLIEQNLPPELLSPMVSKAVRQFCPRFNGLRVADKRAYWAYFFQALAGAEAGLRPTADVKHTESEVAVIDKVTRHVTRQQGLLQLTYYDSERYGCNFDWDKDKDLAPSDADKTILQPKNNLLCGIHILKNQLIDLHLPLLTPKSYWSTLRPGTVSYKVFAREMTNLPVACGAKTARTPKKEAPPLREAATAAVPTRPAGYVSGSNR